MQYRVHGGAHDTMPIIGYVGLDGSGKTYHMTRVALRLMERGIDVFSLHHVEGAFPFDDLREMLRMRRCHIFLDEVHQKMGSELHHTDVDPVFRHVVSQHRKYEQTIHWSAQSWWYVNPFLRRQTGFVWKHHAIFRDKDTGRSKIGLHRAIKIAGVDEELKRRRPQILAKRNLWITKKVHGKYDSYQALPLNKDVVSDDEIAAIQDPYEREKIKKLSTASKELPHEPEQSPDEQYTLNGDKQP